MDSDDDREPDEIVILKVVRVALAEAPEDRRRKPVDLMLWRQCIAEDPSLVPAEHLLASAHENDPVHRVPIRDGATWLGHSGGLRVTLKPKHGAIVLFLPAVDDPEIDTDGHVAVDAETQAKCEEIAGRLGAQVCVSDVEIPVWHDQRE